MPIEKEVSNAIFIYCLHSTDDSTHGINLSSFAMTFSELQQFTTFFWWKKSFCDESRTPREILWNKKNIKRRHRKGTLITHKNSEFRIITVDILNLFKLLPKERLQSFIIRDLVLLYKPEPNDVIFTTCRDTENDFELLFYS